MMISKTIQEYQDQFRAATGNPTQAAQTPNQMASEHQQPAANLGQIVQAQQQATAKLRRDVRTKIVEPAIAEYMRRQARRMTDQKYANAQMVGIMIGGGGGLVAYFVADKTKPTLDRVTDFLVTGVLCAAVGGVATLGYYHFKQVRIPSEMPADIVKEIEKGAPGMDEQDWSMAHEEWANAASSSAGIDWTPLASSLGEFGVHTAMRYLTNR